MHVCHLLTAFFHDCFNAIQYVQLLNHHRRSHVFVRDTGPSPPTRFEIRPRLIMRLLFVMFNVIGRRIEFIEYEFVFRQRILQDIKPVTSGFLARLCGIVLNEGQEFVQPCRINFGVYDNRPRFVGGGGG